MEKKSVLSTIRFIFFTVLALGLIFTAVVITVLNNYKPAVKTYIAGRFIGYFSSEEQFDEAYNDLVTEKQAIDSNVKVYLEEEPVFESSYIRDSLFEDQNIYTNLRAEIKTEYTIYEVAVDDEVEMTFNSKDEANKYAEDVKEKVSDVNKDADLKVEVAEKKVEELGEMTSVERADAILNDIVDRNKPVVIPTTTVVSNTYNTTTTDATASSQIADMALAEGGIWPTTARYISSSYGWRWGSMHSGTDIAGQYADPIYAYKSGLVTFTGWNGPYGYMVKIDHGNGFSTWYAHCSSLYVSAGQEVSQGETIAAMGSTGWSTGNHLHFETRINGVHTDSYAFIAGK